MASVVLKKGKKSKKGIHVSQTVHVHVTKRQSAPRTHGKLPTQSFSSMIPQLIQGLAGIARPFIPQSTQPILSHPIAVKTPITAYEHAQVERVKQYMKKVEEASSPMAPIPASSSPMAPFAIDESLSEPGYYSGPHAHPEIIPAPFKVPIKLPFIPLNWSEWGKIHSVYDRSRKYGTAKENTPERQQYFADKHLEYQGYVARKISEYEAESAIEDEAIAEPIAVAMTEEPMAPIAEARRPDPRRRYTPSKIPILKPKEEGKE